MNLSNTAQYAIRVIAYMASKKEKIYSAALLVEKLNISDKYLKRILTTLSNSGIIKSLQGRYGGFYLERKLDEIKLFDIVKSVEDIEKYFGCILGFEECSDKNPCTLHTKWAPVRDSLLKFMNEISVSDIIDNPQIIKF